MHLVRFQASRIRVRPAGPTLILELLAQCRRAIFNFVFFNTIHALVVLVSASCCADPPFILEPVAELKDLDLDRTFSIMLEYLLVGLSLSMSEVVEVLGIWLAVVSRFKSGEIALHIARRTATTRSR